jgi:hypothetical protein
MKRNLIGMLLMLPLATALLLGLLLPGNVQGASVLITESNISYSPLEPAPSDSFNISVEPTFVQADPVEEGVVLMWSLCTDEGCGIATPQVMNDNGDGTWSYEFESFPEEDPNGNPYIDVLFYIKVTYTPEGGGEESTVQSDAVSVYFTEPAVDDDDDDDTTPVDDDDDEDGDDSPFGFEIVIAGIILSGVFFVYRRRTNRD